MRARSWLRVLRLRNERGYFGCTLESGVGKRASVTETGQEEIGEGAKGELGTEGEWLWLAGVERYQGGQRNSPGELSPVGGIGGVENQGFSGEALGSRDLGPAPGFGELLPTTLTPPCRPGSAGPGRSPAHLADPLLEGSRHSPIGCRTTPNPNPRSIHLRVRPDLIFAYRAFQAFHWPLRWAARPPSLFQLTAPVL